MGIDDSELTGNIVGITTNNDKTQDNQGNRKNAKSGAAS